MLDTLSEEQKIFSIDALDRGYSARKVGRELGGVNHKVIVKLALQSGFEFVGRQRLMRTQKKENIRAFLESNLSGARAAKHFGFSRAAMYSIAKYLGIDLLGRYQVDPETKRRIVEAVQTKGLSTREAAMEVGNTNYETVRRVAWRSGVRLRAQAEAVHAYFKDPAFKAKRAKKRRMKIEREQQRLFIEWITSPRIDDLADSRAIDPKSEAKRRARLWRTLNMLRRSNGSLRADNG